MDINKKAPVTPPLSPPLRNIGILRQHSNHRLLRSNLSMNASYSSDALSDSSQSRASTGRISRSSLTTKRRNGAIKLERSISRTEKVASGPNGVVGDLGTVAVKKRCSWVTPNTSIWLYNLRLLRSGHRRRPLELPIRALHFWVRSTG